MCTITYVNSLLTDFTKLSSTGVERVEFLKFIKCQLSYRNKILKGRRKKPHCKPHAAELFPVSKFTVVTANLSQNSSYLLSLKSEVNKELV